MSAAILVGCGKSSPNAPNQPSRNVVSLAKAPTGGAQTVWLSGNRLYFDNYNRGEVLSVAASGGEIVTHYKSTGSPGAVVQAGSTIFILNTLTRGELQTLPSTAEGISTLSVNQTISSSPQDITADGTYVYWAEFDNGAAWGSRILRAPLAPTATSALDERGASTDKLIPFDLQGIARLAREGNQLFVSAGGTGTLYRVDLSTKAFVPLVSGLVSGTLNQIPLAVAGNYLYAVVDKDANAHGLNATSILRVGKNSGDTATVATGVIMDGKIRSDGTAIYWWDVGGSDFVLHRLASQTGQITDLATIPPTTLSTIYDFAVDATGVWCFARTSGGDISIQSIPITGGSPVPLTTIDPTPPGAMALDATSLYWLGPFNAIHSLPKTGGTPAVVTLEANSSMTAISLTGTHVVWGEGSLGGVRKIPKTGQTIPTSPWSADLSGMPRHMATDGSTVFWISENSNAGTTDVLSIPVAGGSAQPLGTLSGHGSRIFPYEDALFVAKNTPGGWVISVMPKTGGNDVDVVAAGQEITDLYVFEDVLYFISGAVFAKDLNNGTLTELVPGRPGTMRVYVDARHVYWSEMIGAFGGVYRVVRSGGMPETIYSGRSSLDITGDAGHIYWAAQWEVLRADK